MVRNRTSVLVGMSLVLFVGCGGGSDPVSPRVIPTPTPIPPLCANIAGSWNAALSNSCRGPDRGLASVTQAGCVFVLTMVGSRYSQGFLGTIQGNRVVVGADAPAECEGRVTGIGDVVGGRSLTVNYNGTVTYDWGGCVCALGPISGSFTLTR